MATKEVKLKYKIPKTVGAAIDLLMTITAARQVLTRRAEIEKEQETLVEEKIFDMFGKSELEGAMGKLATASIQRVNVPTLKDWNKFSAYVKKNDAFDLLQRRLSSEACRLRWDAKKDIPGVEVFTRVSLKLTKRKK